ncbi:bifunctional PUB-like domain superfamily/PUB domain [Babesia duncani]|uniref:Bifunctional PUB-like domain superfamily/PUB domain n=1 Tax=Babesia duncani TaxID=323732 RepID=A0AAD9PN33_9APIC|nr:bifunctional PUB-like domain superfamily/PUB domain [Babesia duncani]
MLSFRFQEVEQVLDRQREYQANNQDVDDHDIGISILEETRRELERIAKARLLLQQEQQQKTCMINFDSIPKGKASLETDILYNVKQIYKSHTPTDLLEILDCIYRAHADHFSSILENIIRLIREITRKPDELVFRILRLKNQKLQDDVLRYSQSVALLKYLQFQLVHAQDITQVLQDGKCSYCIINGAAGVEEIRDEHYLYLQEPDIETLDREWSQWLQFLVDTLNKLESFMYSFKILEKANSKNENIITEAFKLSKDF